MELGREKKVWGIGYGEKSRESWVGRKKYGELGREKKVCGVGYGEKSMGSWVWRKK